MQVIESPVVEVFMYRESNMVTYAEHGTECVCTWPQMGNLTKELKSMSFFLQRIRFGIGSAVNLNLLGMNFNRLA